MAGETIGGLVQRLICRRTASVNEWRRDFESYSLLLVYGELDTSKVWRRYEAPYSTRHKIFVEKEQ